MTLGGWFAMVISLTFVVSLAIWCFKRVLASPQEEKAPTGFGP
jgi:hypothetical protein